MGFPNPKKMVEKEVKKAVDRIIKPAADAGKSIVNKTADYAKRSVGDVANKAKRGIQDAANSAQRELREVANDAEQIANDAKHDIEGATRDLGEQIEKIPEAAEHAVQTACEHLADAVTEHGLKIVRDICVEARDTIKKEREGDPELVDAINALGFDLALGPVTLGYDGFADRADDLCEALDRFISEPPDFRRGPIINLVDALGPTDVTIGADVSFALVLGSDALGVGGSLKSIPLKLFTRIADRVLEKMGVPE